MQSKQRAISKFCVLTQKQRDLMSVQLETLRQQTDQAFLQIEQLQDLKTQTRSQGVTHAVFHREMLLNQCRVEGMLSKMIDHQQHELQLMHAQYHSLKGLLEAKHCKVKGLEAKLEDWQREQRVVEQKKEELILEEMVNNLAARKVLEL